MREQIIDLLADHHDASLWSAEYREALADAIMAIVRSSDLAWQCSVDRIVKLKQARQELWTAQQSVSRKYAYLAPGVKVATAALDAFDKALQIQGLLDAVEKESPATVVDSSD